MTHQISTRIIKIKQVKDLTHKSYATIWRNVKSSNPQFPKPFKIGPNSTAWDEQEVLDWIEACKAQRTA